jgi:hypothetical protein
MISKILSTLADPSCNPSWPVLPIHDRQDAVNIIDALRESSFASVLQPEQETASNWAAPVSAASSKSGTQLLQDNSQRPTAGATHVFGPRICFRALSLTARVEVSSRELIRPTSFRYRSENDPYLPARIVRDTRATTFCDTRFSCREPNRIVRIALG